MSTKWVVITGAPVSGKTSVVRFLEANGVRVKHEAATLYIDGQIRLGRSKEEVCAPSNQPVLQREIPRMHAQMESALDPAVPHILDRAVPDVLAYCRLYEHTEADVWPHITRRYYRKVFLLNRLPWEGNDVRIEDDNVAQRLDAFMEEVYAELGYDVVRIPVLSHPDASLEQEERIAWSVQQRAEMILKLWND